MCISLCVCVFRCVCVCVCVCVYDCVCLCLRAEITSRGAGVLHLSGSREGSLGVSCDNLHFQQMSKANVEQCVASGHVSRGPDAFWHDPLGCLLDHPHPRVLLYHPPYLPTRCFSLSTLSSSRFLYSPFGSTRTKRQDATT